MDRNTESTCQNLYKNRNIFCLTNAGKILSSRNIFTFARPFTCQADVTVENDMENCFPKKFFLRTNKVLFPVNHKY